jgi:two-component system sensor histidine kinase UhpB
VPLFWRVFLVNAVILCAAATALALSPATVSFPIAVTELLVLAAGLPALLLINGLLLRRAFAPLRGLAEFMRAVDPLRPGARADMEPGDPELNELVNAFNDMIDRLERERRDSARRALAAQERERLRISRELHDEVGQRLTAVMLRLDGGEATAAAREDVRVALEEVRAIGRGLRPEALDDLGLPAALRSLGAGLDRASGIRVEVDAEASGDLSDEEELVVYRVAQEALTNAVRHSAARRISVRLRSSVDGALLTIEDDGRGFQPPGTVGDFRGMRERAVLVGGRLDIDSEPGRGTRIALVLGAPA